LMNAQCPSSQLSFPSFFTFEPSRCRNLTCIYIYKFDVARLYLQSFVSWKHRKDWKSTNLHLCQVANKVSNNDCKGTQFSPFSPKNTWTWIKSAKDIMIVSIFHGSCSILYCECCHVEEDKNRQPFVPSSNYHNYHTSEADMHWSLS
jgi:hypothetical protein